MQEKLIEPQILIDRHNALLAVLATYTPENEVDARNSVRLELAVQKIIDELTERRVPFYAQEGRVILGLQPPSIEEQKEQLNALNREIAFRRLPGSSQSALQSSSKRIAALRAWFTQYAIQLYALHDQSYTILTPIETHLALLQAELRSREKELASRLIRIQQLAEETLSDMQNEQITLNSTGVFQQEPLLADRLIAECAMLRRIITLLKGLHV